MVAGLITGSRVPLQLQQAVSLFALLVLAKYTAHFYLSWGSVVAILAFAVALEHICLLATRKKLDFFSFSSLSTAMGVMLMMTTPQLWIYFMVIGVGLLQKHVLVFEKRHFFNPSNFALLFGLFFFYDDAHLVLGQLGDAPWLVALVVILAMAVLVRANRWMISLAFAASYLFLQYLLVVQHDPVVLFEQIHHRFYSVSFVVFTLFMLTDPRTTPSSGWQQLLFGFALALIAACLDRYYGFRVQHLFIALFVLSPLVPFAAGWRASKERKKLLLLTSMLLAVVLGVSVSIERKAPYYFEMHG